MRYVITESKIEGAIIQYLDSLFDIENLHWTHPQDYDEDAGYVGEDENRIQFYIGDYEGEDEGCFKYYACEYFIPDSYAREICPTISIEPVYARRLNGYFGNLWHEPFKKWFTLHFDLPIKTIEWM